MQNIDSSLGILVSQHQITRTPAPQRRNTKLVTSRVSRGEDLLCLERQQNKQSKHARQTSIDRPDMQCKARQSVLVEPSITRQTALCNGS